MSMSRKRVDLRRASGRGSKAYRELIINDPCVFCGQPSQSIDHIHPTARDGLNQWTNFAPTCLLCNNKKGTLSLLGFMLNRAGRISRREAATLNDVEITVDRSWDEQPDFWFDPLGLIVKRSDEHVIRL